MPGEGEVIVIYYRCGTGPGVRLTSEQLVMFRSCFFLSIPPSLPASHPLFLPFSLAVCARGIRWSDSRARPVSLALDDMRSIAPVVP